jgi:hypothetical protein
MKHYRLLKIGEIIKEGDEVRRSDGKWYTTICAEDRVEKNDSHPYSMNVLTIF